MGLPCNASQWSVRLTKLVRTNRVAVALHGFSELPCARIVVAWAHGGARRVCSKARRGCIGVEMWLALALLLLLQGREECEQFSTSFTVLLEAKI